jgi:hypothetical protein
LPAAVVGGAAVVVVVLVLILPVLPVLLNVVFTRRLRPIPAVVGSVAPLVLAPPPWSSLVILSSSFGFLFLASPWS